MSGKGGFQDHGGGGRAWFPVWLVAAATVAGLLYVLSAERETAPPGSPEEIAERTAPVGRLSLAQPVPAAKAAAPANGPTSSRSAPEAGTGRESAPVEPVPVATTVTSDEAVSGETRGSQAASPESQTPAAPADRTPPAPADQPKSVDTQPAGTEPVAAGRVSETAAAPDAVADAAEPPVAAEGLPPQHWGKPVPMRLIPRPHLPGQPYQLVPAPADARPE